MKQTVCGGRRKVSLLYKLANCGTEGVLGELLRLIGIHFNYPLMVWWNGIAWVRVTSIFLWACNGADRGTKGVLGVLLRLLRVHSNCPFIGLVEQRLLC